MSELENNFILTHNQHKEILEIILEEKFINKHKPDKCKSAFIGGQPGSGKSTLTEKTADEFTHNVVIIDPDNLRDYHPDYKKLLQQDSRTAAALVHPDASTWAGELFNEAVKEGYNLVVDGTMKNKESITSQCHQLREAGYHTEVRLMAANSLMSRLGIQQRYEGQIQEGGSARWVDKEIHDEAFTGIPKTINYLLCPKQQTPASIISRTKTTSSNKPNYYRHKQHKKSACQLAENRLVYRYSVWSRYFPSLPVVLLCQREI